MSRQKGQQGFSTSSLTDREEEIILLAISALSGSIYLLKINGRAMAAEIIGCFQSVNFRKMRRLKYRKP